MIAGIGGWLFFCDPSKIAWLPPCPLHALTGLYCPGCGSTRALHQLAHGHFVAALRFNPLLVVSLPLLVGLSVTRFICERNGRPCPRWLVHPRMIWILLGVVVAFGILRNLPGYPFSLLRP